MARDLLADDPEFVNDLENRLRDREFVKSLTVIRSRSGLSQQELAAKIGCTQSKISKLESGNDVDLKFGDIVSYLQAANYEAKIFFVPKGGNLVDEVKLHAFLIQQYLGRMVELAGTDSAITNGVARFIHEAAYNLTQITKMAADALPKLPSGPNRPVQVETPEPDIGTQSKEAKHQSRRIPAHKPVECS